MRAFDLSKPDEYQQALNYARWHEDGWLHHIRSNFHRLSDNAFRSAQPMPARLQHYIQRYQLKTVVNLRGAQGYSPLQQLEQYHCQQAGVHLHMFKMFSRDIPKLDYLKHCYELLTQIEYPALFHCKAGSDRAGFISVLYLHWIKQVAIEDAVKQMNFWPYGHFRYAKTGLLDFFFERYIAYNQQSPISLLDWAEHVMDRNALKTAFKANSGTSFLVDKLLKRE